MAKRMTKQVKMMVEEANNYLRTNHIKDTADNVFNITQWLLLQGKCYHGYNYFTIDGRLSGGDNEKFDHLELYIF